MTAVVRGKMCSMQTHKQPRAASSSYSAAAPRRENWFPDHQGGRGQLSKSLRESHSHKEASRMTQGSMEFGNKFSLHIISLHGSVV